MANQCTYWKTLSITDVSESGLVLSMVILYIYWVLRTNTLLYIDTQHNQFFFNLIKKSFDEKYVKQPNNYL